jgi:hypothetical protein
MNNQLKLFNGLMTYLRPMGSVGTNIEMNTNSVEYFDGVMWRENGNAIKIIKIFKEFLVDQCNKNGLEMWNSTNKEDSIWNVDVTVNPQEKEIVLQTNYMEHTSNQYRQNWDWWDIPAIEVDYISNVFKKNKNVEKLIFDCSIRDDDFNLSDFSLQYKNGKFVSGEVNDYYRLRSEIKRLLKFKILGEIDYDEIGDGDGFDATIVCGREEETSYVSLEVYDREFRKGKRIIIDENYFKTENINENQTEMDFNDKINDETFNGYINIKEPEDSNPSNLNIEIIQKNTRFAKLLNTILYELYKDNLGMNDDNSKYGIIDVYPLNEFTSWSILNYFGGHKFVKQRLLDQFNKTSNKKTPKEFYRWLIENQERLLKTGPILKGLIRTNFNTYNKGTVTEKYVIEKLKSLNYEIKYFPPGSKKDREGGVDIEVNGISYQIKELTGVDEIGDKIYLRTPMPKNYLGLEVKKIMLVDVNTGEFISFPNKNYEIDIKENAYIIDNQYKEKIKSGNFNKL